MLHLEAIASVVANISRRLPWRRAERRVDDSPVFLIFAAVLEVGGDALCRAGLRGSKWGLLIHGGVVLWLYGITVNAPWWHFGRLLGVYIAVFFVVSQAVAVSVFRESLSPIMLIGGALIVAGGLVLVCWSTTTSAARIGTPQAFSAPAPSEVRSQESPNGTR